MFSSLLYHSPLVSTKIQFYTHTTLKIDQFIRINIWFKNIVLYTYLMFHWDTFIGNELNDSKDTEINDEKENLDDSFEDPGMIDFF